MSYSLRIGTRDSRLALWQAGQVQALLLEKNIRSELVPVKSEGDLDLVTPLYAMGVEGVFTKTLDAYLLSNKIDIAVHSMKDVPTQLAQGIVQGAVLKRGKVNDILIPNKKSGISGPRIIATGSVRRKAQWSHRYPDTRFENLRGNVQTRLNKLEASNWSGIIMAQAGLERIGLLPKRYEVLDWMLPAPAQGAIMIVCRETDTATFENIRSLNDAQTALCTKIERDFLRTLMGGCSTPISALAAINEDKVFFKGNIISPDGKEKTATEQEAIVLNADELGIAAAQALLNKGADLIMKAIKNGAKP